MISAMAQTPSPPAYTIEPAAIARWLLIIYAVGVLALLEVPAISAWRGGQADLLVWSLPLLAWIVGPAALGAVLVRRAKSRVEAWLFVGAEVAAVGSVVWLGIVLFLAKPDAQNGIAMILFPAVQYAVLLSYTSGVLGTVLFLRSRSSQP